MKTSPPEIKSDNLVRWLADGRADAYFGKAFTLKFEILSSLAAGGKINLAAIARARGLTRAATSKQYLRCKAIYGLTKS